jgi:hypothetical protein
MTRRALLPASALLIAALVPAGPAAAATKAPVVRSVSPKKVKVGKKLTIKGRHFVAGKHRTRVFFLRVKGAGVASAVAKHATSTRLVVVVPRSLNRVLNAGHARFKLRVLTKRFGAWTRPRKSPVVYAASGGGSTGPTSAAGDCDRDGKPNNVDTDDDNDLLPDTLEGPDIAHGQIGTDPCNADSDGDGVSDGFEWQSAVDLNRTVLFGATKPLPYPGKRPYPNPLFPDRSVDYDGDGLTLGQEQLLWKHFGGSRFPLDYSDGLATTVPTPLPAGIQFKQLDTTVFGPDFNDGWLNDGERDADHDGLSNWDEFNGRMTPEWWIEEYDGKNNVLEKPYPITFVGTDAWDRDSDGDGVPDGLDDQDHDGLSNLYEVARPWNWDAVLPNTGGYISVASDGQTHIHDGDNPWARVQPFNPCKPVFSKTCHRHPPFGYYDGEDWEGMYPADAVDQYDPPGIVPGPPVSGP